MRILLCTICHRRLSVYCYCSRSESSSRRASELPPATGQHALSAAGKPTRGLHPLRTDLGWHRMQRPRDILANKPILSTSFPLSPQLPLPRRIFLLQFFFKIELKSAHLLKLRVTANSPSQFQIQRDEHQPSSSVLRLILNTTCPYLTNSEVTENDPARNGRNVAPKFNHLIFSEL
ncbi:hypothetical protein T01_13393 [Trichinella spiralis]|uniref:Uncharacterized protein n=1 Tax=Trichinella spiralis TaxID=6334 RepID=A0A0V1B5I3_TRISP|nr:hypothetical protein T01_13393 [Trichinella spiralis]